MIYVETFLYSILKNLISNEIKYKKDVPLQINIKGRKEDGFVILKVKDNGIGIDLNKYEKQIFKPFKRFTNTVEGTGVGLYLIKNMISRNGGEIKVESEPGKGTTFYCYLKEYKYSQVRQ